MSNPARAAQQSWINFTADKAVAKLEFDQHWVAEKQRRKDTLAEAIKECFRRGMSVPEVSAATGNANHTFLYQLRAEQEAGQHREVSVVTEEDLGIDFFWEYHNHKGVHGWLLDIDKVCCKVYGTPGTEFEGEYAIFDDSGSERKQLAGNTAFGSSISDREFSRRTTMLLELLHGEYTKRIVEEDNPHKS